MPSPLLRAQDLAERLDDPGLVIVDCRFDLMKPDAGRSAYDAGHIARARYADLNRDLSAPARPGVTGRHPLPDPEALAQTFGSWGITSDSTVVAYDDASGALAARLWWLLHWLGHERVLVLDGGFAAWQEIGGRTEMATSESAASTFVPEPRPELLASVEQVLTATRTRAPVLLDARAAPRFRGDEEPIDRVPGHIPSARSLPFMTLLEAGKFATPERIRAAFEGALGAAPSSDTICYCGSGVTACHLILGAVHAGLPMPRLYAGSYSEWITVESRPVERG